MSFQQDWMIPTDMDIFGQSMQHVQVAGGGGRTQGVSKNPVIRKSRHSKQIKPYKTVPIEKTLPLLTFTCHGGLPDETTDYVILQPNEYFIYPSWHRVAFQCISSSIHSILNTSTDLKQLVKHIEQSFPTSDETVSSFQIFDHKKPIPNLRFSTAGQNKTILFNVGEDLNLGSIPNLLRTNHFSLSQILNYIRTIYPSGFMLVVIACSKMTSVRPPKTQQQQLFIKQKQQTWNTMSGYDLGSYFTQPIQRKDPVKLPVLGIKYASVPHPEIIKETNRHGTFFKVMLNDTIKKTILVMDKDGFGNYWDTVFIYEDSELVDSFPLSYLDASKIKTFEIEDDLYTFSVYLTPTHTKGGGRIIEPNLDIVVNFPIVRVNRLFLKDQPWTRLGVDLDVFLQVVSTTSRNLVYFLVDFETLIGVKILILLDRETHEAFIITDFENIYSLSDISLHGTGKGTSRNKFELSVLYPDTPSSHTILIEIQPEKENVAIYYLNRLLKVEKRKKQQQQLKGIQQQLQHLFKDQDFIGSGMKTPTKRQEKQALQRLIQTNPQVPDKVSSSQQQQIGRGEPALSFFHSSSKGPFKYMERARKNVSHRNRLASNRPVKNKKRDKEGMRMFLHQEI